MTDIEENLAEERMTFDDWIQDENCRNAWIYEDYLQAYVRRSKRFIDDKITPCLDIGSVEVCEDVRGQGVFSVFLTRFELAAKAMKRVVIVESILNPRFVSFLKRRGYKIHPHSCEMVPTMYKVLDYPI